MSPKQIVPTLADENTYIASESSMYRVLRAEGQMTHRGRAKPPRHHRPKELVATGPNQVWSWDISWLPSLVRGRFFFLYMIIDVFSRKIVAHAVHDREDDVLAAALVAAACAAEGVAREQLVIHSDNGKPMKGATMLATLQQLGVMPSFSRPHVSDDNPYSESLFRTLKYRPEYPACFASIEAAAAWVEGFVDWYNNAHLHSAIGFVTPAQRHCGDDQTILLERRNLYQAARRKRPERWSGSCRDWQRIEAVSLNPAKGKTPSAEGAA